MICRGGCDLTAGVTYSFLNVNSPLALLIILLRLIPHSLTFYFSVGDHDDDGHLLRLPSPSSSSSLSSSSSSLSLDSPLWVRRSGLPTTWAPFLSNETLPLLKTNKCHQLMAFFSGTFSRRPGRWGLSEMIALVGQILSAPPEN